MVAKPWQERMTGEAPVEIFAAADSDVNDFNGKSDWKKKAAPKTLRHRKILRKTMVNLRMMAASHWVYFTLVGKGLK